jgi:hypothetical protein
MLDHLRRDLAVAGLALLTAALAVAPAHAATPTPAPSDASSPSSSTAPAAGLDLVSFGIAPAGVERPDDRPYLSYTAAPGSVIYDHVALLNQDDTPIGLQLYPGDVVMSDGTGLGVPPRDQAPTDAGSWIAIDAASANLQVPAQTKDAGIGYTVVPFSLTIPVNAQPGDHVGGLVGSLVTTGKAGDNTPAIDLEQRVVARVYIRVTGDLRPGLAITDVTATHRGGGLAGQGAGTVEVGYTLRNTGNVRMAVQPDVRVAGPVGLLPRTAAGDRVDELLPGSEVHLTTTVSGVWPLGRESVTVSATGLPSATGEDPGVGTVHASTQVWAIPWAVLALLVLLAGLVAYRVRRRRRRRQPVAARGRRVAQRDQVSSGSSAHTS